MILLAILGSNPPGVSGRNGFPNVQKHTQIIKLKYGMCRIHYHRLICIKNRPPMAVITSFNQIYKKKLILDPWGNEVQFAPIAMKFDPMETNYQILKIKPKYTLITVHSFKKFQYFIHPFESIKITRVYNKVVGK